MDIDRHAERKHEIVENELRRKVDILELKLRTEIDLRCRLHQLLGECLRLHYYDEYRCSASWLREVQAIFEVNTKTETQ